MHCGVVCVCVMTGQQTSSDYPIAWSSHQPVSMRGREGGRERGREEERRWREGGREGYL